MDPKDAPIDQSQHPYDEELVLRKRLVLCTSSISAKECEDFSTCSESGWMHLCCPHCESDATCSLSVESWSCKVVISSNRVLEIEIPNLSCGLHPGKGSFSALEVWPQVLSRCQKQQARIQPDVVLLQDHILITRAGYTCASAYDIVPRRACSGTKDLEVCWDVSNGTGLAEFCLAGMFATSSCLKFALKQ